ncbi:MAG: type III secretion system export apparatus subunit SctU [Bryobacteraceae bacterium]
MSGEKTEAPTPKKIKDARKKGQVAKSNDLTQAFLFLTAALVLAGGGPAFVDQLKNLMHDFFRPSMLDGSVSQDAMLKYMGDAWLRFLFLSAPLMGAMFLIAAAVMYLQVKSLFAPEVLKPKLDKLNPIKGFQNIFFKAKTYIELIKNLVKFAVILFLVYKSIEGAMHDVILTARTTLSQTALLAGTLMSGMLYKVGAAFVVIGAADFMLQKKQYIKELRMSKYEVEKEYKQEEGDPHIKGHRRQLHRELLNESMIENVPEADVVVVNPAHLAIALKYDGKAMSAPRVTAKGQELSAKRIIELARRSGVPVMRNVPLAHSLYELEVGRDIPEDLYEAVAEVLNWVYQLSQEAKA